MCESLGGKPSGRNESEGRVRARAAAHHRPIRLLAIGLSKSVYVGTRKMVNYA